MSTEQEREYTLSVMHVTEFTTQLGVKMSDLAVVYGAQVDRSPTHIGAQTQTALWKQTDRKDEEHNRRGPMTQYTLQDVDHNYSWEVITASWNTKDFWG